MKWGMAGSAAFAVIMLAVLAASLLGAGNFALGDREVTPAEFWRAGGGLQLLIVSVWLGAVAVGFRRELVWARPLAATFWFAMAVLAWFAAPRVGWDSGDVAANVATSIMLGLLALWYFYRKRSVLAYYGALRTG
jgi:hypothetical protein